MLKGSKMSAESRAKMSAARMGRFVGEMSPKYGKPVSAETRKKMSISHTGILVGEKNPNYGKHLSAETRAKLSASRLGRPYKPGRKSAMLGKHLTSEQKMKRSGENSPLYGKPRSPEVKAKISAANTGKIRSPETIEKYRKCQLGKEHPTNQGEKCHLWRGGVSYGKYCRKFNPNLKIRIRAFFGHECVMCGKKEFENGVALSCHHVDYSKSACCDDLPVQFAALCIPCHSTTGHDRDVWEPRLHRIIDEIYLGKSYYTKEEWANRKIDNERG